MKYTLSIHRVTVNNTADKIVTTVDWRLLFYNDANEYVGKDSGMVLLGEPDPANTIPFDQIDPETMQTWVVNQLDIDKYYQAALARAAQKNTTAPEIDTVLTPPWEGGTPYKQKTRGRANSTNRPI